MAWWTDKKETDAAKEILSAIPDKLKEKTPAELKALLENSLTSQDRITALEREKGEEAQKVTTLTTQYTSIKQKLDAIEANGRPAPTNNNNDLPPANFVEDPDRAFNERAAPIAALAVNTGSMTARMLAQQELNNRDMASGGKNHDGRLFLAWAQEIDARAKQYNQTNLVYPNTWLEIFYTVKGLHADELRDPESRKKNYAFMEPASTNVQRTEDPNRPAAEQLTPQELKVAERMNVTPENYLKRKKSMQFVGA